MMELFNAAMIIFGVFVVLLFGGYAIVRFWSTAHFRARAEYDRGAWSDWVKDQREDG